MGRTATDTMARYFRTADGYIAVTNETPNGPLRGVVLIGRGPEPGGGPETISEQAFPKYDLDTLTAIGLDEVPDAWLEALKYDWPRPALQVETIRVNFLPEVFEPHYPKPIPWRLWPLVLGTLLYIVALFAFHYAK